MATANPFILTKFRAALKELYGDRIERVVLYGSRARGDARSDSDYDVAVFLKDMTDRWNEIGDVSPNRRKFRQGLINPWRIDEGPAC